MVASVHQLCDVLIRSRLLSADEVRALQQRWQATAGAAGADAAKFCKWLVDQQQLTEFQASRLLRGATERFFFNDYKLLDIIGRGRNAGVYRAVHALGQVVAIKVLPPSKVKDPQILGRFQREARLALRLKHPNVVRTFQTGEGEGVHYLVMEFLDGEDLEEILKRRKQLPPVEATRIIYQALQGLQHLHEEGMVHRDLKPANLMLVPGCRPGQPDNTLEATVKVLDIGLGRALFDETEPGAGKLVETNKGDSLGDPTYRAPEQARDARTADVRADIYSLGCVFYHLLTGQPPFAHSNTVQQVLLHATEPPRPLKEFDPTLPDGLQAIVFRMMAKDAAQRYPTPAQAAEALQGFLSAGAVPALEAPRQVQAYLNWVEANERDGTAVKAAAPATLRAAPAMGILVSRPSRKRGAPQRPRSVPAGWAKWRKPTPRVACVAGICLAALLAVFLLWPGNSPSETQPDASNNDPGKKQPDASNNDPEKKQPDGNKEGLAKAQAPPDKGKPAAPAVVPLGLQVRAVFEKNCYRCHGQDDEVEAGVYILESDKLVAAKKVVPGNPDNSRLYQRVTSAKRPMPPEDETPRPSAADIALIKQWIAAGAPSLAAAPAPVAVAAAQLDTGYLLTAVRDHLLKLPEEDRKFQRYFTFCHLYNNPEEKKSLPLYRAGLAKLVNSLSWKRTIVQPRAVDAAATIYVLDLRALDWEAPDRWQDIVRAYPYGLRYDIGANARLRPLTEEIERLAGNPLPFVRADWFIASASRPPLYHSILALPPTGRQLEQLLGVNLEANFANNKLRRAGFLKSNVSSQNRLIERHASTFGAYWRSYDFRGGQNRDNLVQFPLGPGPGFIRNHPFPEAAFEQAGGEIIFNLPNGLQAYLLVDGKDNRLDIAPIEVVRDRDEVAGTAQIVNGLSCMSCHVNGMITGDQVKDVIRDGYGGEGAARSKVEQLYAPRAEMDKLLQQDADRFARAMKKTLEPFPGVGAEEPISAVARPFVKKGIGLKEAAFELGLPDAQVLQQAIQTNRALRQLGLEPLAQGNAIQRATWEQLDGNQSVFQKVASELGLGTPIR